MLCQLSYSRQINIMGRGGFEPPKSSDNRFTVCPLWPLGYLPPNSSFFKDQSWRRDSNPRPSDYKSLALPAELRQLSQRGLVYAEFYECQEFFSYFLQSRASLQTYSYKTIATEALTFNEPAGPVKGIRKISSHSL